MPPLLTSKRMFAVNLVIIVESIRSIASHKGDDTNEFFIPAVAAVASALGRLPALSPAYIPATDTLTVGVKFLLFLYCYVVRKSSSQVRMLWEDHRNDLFVNGFGKMDRTLKPLVGSANLP